MLSFLRPSLQPIYRALGAPFIALHIHPQWVSLLGLPFGVACAYAYATQRWVWALVLFPLTALWDAIDGSVPALKGRRPIGATTWRR